LYIAVHIFNFLKNNCPFKEVDRLLNLLVKIRGVLNVGGVSDPGERLLDSKYSTNSINSKPNSKIILGSYLGSSYEIDCC
jgi:hypothetical protein